MSGRSEETQHCDEERPRPVRFSIFGQIQQQVQRGREAFDQLHHHVSIKGLFTGLNFVGNEFLFGFVCS